MVATARIAKSRRRESLVLAESPRRESLLPDSARFGPGQTPGALSVVCSLGASMIAGRKAEGMKQQQGKGRKAGTRPAWSRRLGPDVPSIPVFVIVIVIRDSRHFPRVGEVTEVSGEDERMGFEERDALSFKGNFKGKRLKERG